METEIALPHSLLFIKSFSFYRLLLLLFSLLAWIFFSFLLNTHDPVSRCRFTKDSWEKTERERDSMRWWWWWENWIREEVQDTLILHYSERTWGETSFAWKKNPRKIPGNSRFHQNFISCSSCRLFTHHENHEKGIPSSSRPTSLSILVIECFHCLFNDTILA